MYSPDYVRLQLASRPSTPYKTHPLGVTSPAQRGGNQSSTSTAAAGSPLRNNRSSLNQSKNSGSAVKAAALVGGDYGFRTPNRNEFASVEASSIADSSEAAGGESVVGKQSPYSIDFQKRYFKKRADEARTIEEKSEQRAANFYFSLKLAAEREKEFVITKQRNAASARKPKSVYKLNDSTGSSGGHKSVMSDTTGGSGLAGHLSAEQMARIGRAQNRLHLTKEKVLDRLVVEDNSNDYTSRSAFKKEMMSFGLAHSTRIRNEAPPQSSSKHPRSHIAHSPMVEHAVDTSADQSIGSQSKVGGGGNAKKVFMPTVEPGEVFSPTLSAQQKHILLASLEYMTESGVLKDGSAFRQVIGWYRADVKKVLDLLSTKFSDWDCIDYGSIEWNILHNVLTEVRKGHSGQHGDVSRASFFGSVSKRHIERVHDFLLNDIREKTRSYYKAGGHTMTVGQQ